TGYAKPDAVIRTETAPAILGSTAVVSYNEYSMLAKAQPVVTKQGEKVGSVWAWFDELEAAADTIDLRVDHPFFGEFAAMTTRKHGSGSISFLASYPDQQLSTWLGKHFANAAGEIIAPSSNSESVVVNRASTKDGRQVSFVFNWSWNSASVALPTNYQDVESGERLSAGQSIELGAWGVRVLVEEN
ncbi:MAG: Beta-galactosidase C-terminal domain, partial [Rhodoluna sp.]